VEKKVSGKNPLWNTGVEGGYVRIRTFELASVWSAYRCGQLQALDLRVWLSAHEMACRRGLAKMEAGRAPKFSVAEFQGLLGKLPAGKVRASLRRLERLGVVAVRPSSITFASGRQAIRLEHFEEVESMLSNLPQHRCGQEFKVRAWLPLPRRMLRVLTAGVKRNVLATVLGQCAFCLYRRGRVWKEEGRVKASRLAEVFSLSTKSIYRARAHLVAVGFLARVHGPAWATKKYGEKMAVNLAWSREVPAPRMSSVGELSTAKKSTSPYQAPLREKNKDQAPALADLTGVFRKEHAEPSWRNIRREDLESMEGRLKLYASAVREGALTEGEASKLNFLAACERARLRGTSNPCGLLRWLVERNAFRYVTNDEEEAARRALSVVEQGKAARGRGEWSRSRLSGDARFVRDLRRTLAARGVLEDPLPYLQSMRPEWSEARWRNASMELAEV
jgi:hypothetical protein